MQISYRTVDVFTRNRFGGNQLAVIPDARQLSDEAMQNIAAEFNYSETTFVLPPSDPANTAYIRIFTPTDEIPFAGHPNVGTAFLLGEQGNVFGQNVSDTMRFEEAAGLVEVRVVREAGRVVGAEIRVPHLLEVGSRIEAATVAACACLEVNDVLRTAHEPVVVSVGLPFVVAEVAGLDALGRAVPNKAAFSVAEAHYPHPDDRFSLFLYTRLPEEPDRVRARMFAPLSNILEDPATGSASAALGAYLFSLRSEPDLIGKLTVEQGVEMGRRSLIGLAVEKTSGAVNKVAVRGHCVGMMRGTVDL